MNYRIKSIRYWSICVYIIKQFSIIYSIRRARFYIPSDVEIPEITNVSFYIHFFLGERWFSDLFRKWRLQQKNLKLSWHKLDKSKKCASIVVFTVFLSKDHYMKWKPSFTTRNITIRYYILIYILRMLNNNNSNVHYEFS